MQIKYIFLIGIGLCIILLSARVKQKKAAITTPVQLGKLLFFEPLLSGDKTVSCASCHKPELAFADNIAFSNGVNGKKTSRNTPSVMNMASREALFWDGRATSLENQILGPIENPNEMNCPIDTVINRLNQSEKYTILFDKVFNDKPNITTLKKAIAAYERSMETSNTANDRWLNDQMPGLNAQQQRGRHVFFNKGKCIECHFTPDFTGDEFRSIGLFNGKQWNDSGRYNVTKNIEDIGKFKVPGLRNVAITAPYMHDGSFATLEQVIDFYNKPTDFVISTVEVDSLLREPLQMTQMEKQDLIAFLHALTDEKFVKKKK